MVLNIRVAEALAAVHLRYLCWAVYVLPTFAAVGCVCLNAQYGFSWAFHQKAENLLPFLILLLPLLRYSRFSLNIEKCLFLCLWFLVIYNLVYNWNNQTFWTVLHKYIFFMFVCVSVHIPGGEIGVEVRTLCRGVRELNSGCQAWEQMPLPAEPPCSPTQNLNIWKTIWDIWLNILGAVLCAVICL